MIVSRIAPATAFGWLVAAPVAAAQRFGAREDVRQVSLSSIGKRIALLHTTNFKLVDAQIGQAPEVRAGSPAQIAGAM